MKKRITILASIVAICLSLALFTLSVYAAVSQEFSVKNTIRFVGGSRINIIIDGKIEGATSSVDAETDTDFCIYGKNYYYEYDNANTVSDIPLWDAGELTFYDGGDNRRIIFTFKITNRTEGIVRVYFNNDETEYPSVIKDERNNVVANGTPSNVESNPISMGQGVEKTLTYVLDREGDFTFENLAFNLQLKIEA